MRDKIRVGILVVLGVMALVCITAAVYIRIFVIGDATDIWRPRSIGLMLFGSFLCFAAAWVTRHRDPRKGRL